MVRKIMIAALAALALSGCAKKATIGLGHAYTDLGYVTFKRMEAGSFLIWNRKTGKVEGSATIPVREFDANPGPYRSRFFRSHDGKLAELVAQDLDEVSISANFTLLNEDIGAIKAGVKDEVFLTVKGYTLEELPNPATTIRRYMEEQEQTAENELDLENIKAAPENYLFVLAKQLYRPNDAELRVGASGGADADFKVKGAKGKINVKVSRSAEARLKRAGSFNVYFVYRAKLKPNGTLRFYQTSTYKRADLVAALRKGSF